MRKMDLSDNQLKTLEGIGEKKKEEKKREQDETINVNQAHQCVYLCDIPIETANSRCSKTVCKKR